MKKLKFKKILKISGISIVSLVVLGMLLLIIIQQRYIPEKTKTWINDYNNYLIGDSLNSIIRIVQYKRKNELLSCYDYNDKYLLSIWEYNNKNVSNPINYIIKKHMENTEMLQTGTYSVQQIPSDFGLSVAFLSKIEFHSNIFLKFQKNDGVVLSNIKTDKFYSINYLSCHLSIGSSQKNAEVIVQTKYTVKTNLVILNRKGKLVFIFIYAKDGVEPIKDDVLLEILKPSLLTEGLH